MKAAVLLLSCAIASPALAQVDEMLPLEAKVVHLVNELRAKYRGDPKLLDAFDRSADAWNAYRNGHCTVESQARGRGSEAEAKRAFAACAKRELELRVRELEGLH